MKYTTEEKVAFLETLIKEYYTQGDSYYASQTKTGKWRFGYTNDCEMQHGSGEEMMLPDLIVENLMDKTNVKFAIPVVVRQSEQCKHKYDHYTNNYGEVVAVCSKCMKAYFQFALRTTKYWKISSVLIRD